MNFNNVAEFYPTPEYLLEKIFIGTKISEIKTVLEPSAGKGNIADYIKNYADDWHNRNTHLEIDCIELDPTLRKTLMGKEYNVIHDDFLTFNTYKHYDLIVMNPPFVNGCRHLLRALEMQQYGGNIICILNAETLKNPYTNERKDLLKRLEKYNAQIEYVQEAFESAERKTSVEVAIIKVAITEQSGESFIYENMRKKYIAEVDKTECTDVALKDLIEAAVAQYNCETAAGIKLIREYYAMILFIISLLYN